MTAPKKVRKSHGEHYRNYSGEASRRREAPRTKNTKMTKGTEQTPTGPETGEAAGLGDRRSVKTKGTGDVRISNLGDQVVGVIPFKPRGKKRKVDSQGLVGNQLKAN